MADMAGKSKSVGSVAVVYTVQALKKGDAPVPVERHFLFPMRLISQLRI
jgi:hypothetical protein